MNEQIKVMVINKLDVYFTSGSYLNDNGYKGEVFEGNRRVYGRSMGTEKELKKDVMCWIYENYNTPLNLEESDLLYHLSTDEEE